MITARIVIAAALVALAAWTFTAYLRADMVITVLSGLSLCG